MNRKTILFTIILIITGIGAGCGGSGTPANSAGNMNGPNVNSNAPNTSDTLETTRKPDAPTTNQAPTLAPVFRSYCEALVKKDNRALRSVFSAETLQILEKDSNEEKKSLVEFLSEIDRIKDPAQCVARNEQIQGEKGIAELKSESMPVWTAIEFVNEGGSWKLTNKSPELSSVKESVSNSNASK